MLQNFAYYAQIVLKHVLLCMCRYVCDWLYTLESMPALCSLCLCAHYAPNYASIKSAKAYHSDLRVPESAFAAA